MKRKIQNDVALMMNLGAKNFINPKKLCRLSLDPRQQEPILGDKRQSILQPKET